MNTTEPTKWAINPNILHYDIETHSKEWHDFRMRGIGSSEIGTVVGASDFRPLLPELIEQKGGVSERIESMNESMLSGLLAEDNIMKRWSFYDGQGKQYVENYKTGKKIREISNVEGYLFNQKYPHLFVSMDGWAAPDSPNLIDSSEMPMGFPVECKTISGFGADKWEVGVPPSYVFQINMQMMICEIDYCELAILKDGWQFEVYPFQKSETICRIILEKSEEVWELVEKVRLMALEAANSPHKDRIYSEIQSILPLPDENPLYRDFYSEKMLKSEQAITVPITNTVYEYAQKRLRIAEAIKQMEVHQTFYENAIRREFVLAQAEYMESGAEGKVRYYLKEGGKNYQLSFTGFKVKPDTKKIEEVVNETVSQILK